MLKKRATNEGLMPHPLLSKDTNLNVLRLLVGFFILLYKIKKYIKFFFFGSSGIDPSDEDDFTQSTVKQEPGRVVSVPRLTYWNAENVSLELHEESVGGHASVHLQLSQGNPTVLIHGIQDLSHRNKS